MHSKNKFPDVGNVDFMYSIHWKILVVPDRMDPNEIPKYSRSHLDPYCLHIELCIVKPETTCIEQYISNLTYFCDDEC